MKPGYPQSKKTIIFFDGVCNLCNVWVDFLLSVDKGRVFFFAPLQSDAAKNLLPPEYIENMDSLVLLVDDQIYTESAAVFKIAEYLNYPLKIVALGRILPRGLADSFYNLIARSRYKIFGKRNTCRLPTADEKQRFLD